MKMRRMVVAVGMILGVLFTGFALGQVAPVDVTVNGSTLANPVGAGFGWWEGAEPLLINLSAEPGDITRAEVYLPEEVIWHGVDCTQPDPWTFETVAILPDKAFAVIFKGTLTIGGAGGGHGGGGHGGHGGDPNEWAVAVSDIDIDADTDNSGEKTGMPARRSPSSNSSQRLQEDAREVTDNSDGEGGMVIGTGEDWCNVELTLHAKKQGTLTVTSSDANAVVIKTSAEGDIAPETIGPGTITRSYLIKAATTQPTATPVTISATFKGGEVGTVHDEFLVHVRDIVITHCPDFFVPGHENIIKYRIYPDTYTAAYGKLEIFHRDENGDPTGAAVYSYSGSELSCEGGAERMFTYSGTEINHDPGKYVVVIKFGADEESAASDMAGFDVKAWDLYAFFWDKLTDDEKAAIDNAYAQQPQYDPAENEFFGDGETMDAPEVYVAGIDAATVNSTNVSLTRWCWDETEEDAESLTIADGVETRNITAENWEESWGDKQWFDDRGSTVSDLNSIFYSMSEEDQYYELKFTIAAEGVTDKLANGFDGSDEDGIQRTVTYQLRIDGDGEVEILSETWE